MEICRTSFQRQTGCEMDAATAEEYQRTLSAFDVELWKTPMEAGVAFSYADSCYQSGLLEQRLTPAVKHSRVAGQTIRFRINPDLL